jgi:hypothetical protein
MATGIVLDNWSEGRARETGRDIRARILVYILGIGTTRGWLRGHGSVGRICVFVFTVQPYSSSWLDLMWNFERIHGLFFIKHKFYDEK